MKTLYIENCAKNLALIAVLVVCYPIISNSLNSSRLFLDKSLAGNLLIAVSIISVTACFGNFAFSYEQLRTKVVWARAFAHLTTGILMLVIGLSLEIAALLTQAMFGTIIALDVCWILLYIGVTLYDFWDLHRAAVDLPQSRSV